MKFVAVCFITIENNVNTHDTNNDKISNDDSMINASTNISVSEPIGKPHKCNKSLGIYIFV